MSEIEKVYYSIGETAEMFGVNISLLRYWEKEFDMIKPYKNKKGDRYFSKKDIEIIRTIYYLTKEKGYTLQGARQAIKSDFRKESSQAYIVDTLLKLKQLLLDIKQDL